MKSTVLACVSSSLLALWHVADLESQAAAGRQLASPTAAQGSMLGKSPEEVFARYGVPASMGGGGGLLELHYPGKEGDKGVFVFHEDIAVQVPPAEFEAARIEWPVAGRAHTGQRLETAIRSLGSAVEVVRGTQSSQLRFRDGTVVMVCFGRVFPIPG